MPYTSLEPRGKSVKCMCAMQFCLALFHPGFCMCNDRKCAPMPWFQDWTLCVSRVFVLLFAGQFPYFRSPHLLEVRERIRINGQPLSREMFVSYFWDVYSKLNNTRHLYNDSMPSYFRFLTVMAFSVFLSNKVITAML